jgi:hypothetical protein
MKSLSGLKGSALGIKKRKQKYIFNFEIIKICFCFTFIFTLMFQVELLNGVEKNNNYERVLMSRSRFNVRIGEFEEAKKSASSL